MPLPFGGVAVFLFLMKTVCAKKTFQCYLSKISSFRLFSLYFCSLEGIDRVYSTFQLIFLLTREYRARLFDLLAYIFAHSGV